MNTRCGKKRGEAWEEEDGWEGHGGRDGTKADGGGGVKADEVVVPSAGGKKRNAGTTGFVQRFC